MDLWVAPKTGGGTTINFAIGFIPDKAQWTADFKAGEWHQIAIHVHWSSNAANGYVELWFDGVKAPMLKGKTRANDADTLFYQTGLHRKNTVQFTDVIYLDDFIEADTEADAKIAAPTQGGGSDGGVSPDATGAAGTGATGAGGTTGAAGTSGAAGTTGSAGTSGAAGTTGAAGTGGAAGTSGAAGTGSASGAAGTSGPREESSSGCTYAGSNGAGLGWLSALGLIALAVRARRKRG
jgi:hypothetical protein